METFGKGLTVTVTDARTVFEPQEASLKYNVVAVLTVGVIKSEPDPIAFPLIGASYQVTSQDGLVVRVAELLEHTIKFDDVVVLIGFGIQPSNFAKKPSDAPPP